MGSESDSQLIDGHVSLAQSRKAITALLQHIRKEQEHLGETELLPGKEQHVWLVMTVKRMQPMKKLKPQKIPLVHPLVDPRTSSICLITKDPQREYKDLLESHGVKFVSRVVGLQKLRGKFKGFDARRLLLRENDLFLADERVLPLLPGLLGKKWFEAKKQPIPVSLTKKGLKAELEKAVSSTYMHQNRGTCTSIKIATTSQKDTHVLANLSTALPAVVSRIHGGWENVQSLNIKTSSSASLPIWTCPLGGEQPGSRWEGMGVEQEEWSGVGAVLDGDDAAEGVEPKVLEPVKDTPKANGKKRAVESTEAPQESAKKKAKKTKILEDSPKLSVGAAVLTETDPAERPQKKAKKTKKAEDSPSLPVGAAVLPETGLAERPQKKKAKKAKIAEDSPSLPVGAAVIMETDPTERPQKKAKKAKIAEDSPSLPVRAAVLPETDTAGRPQKKPRTKRASAAADVSPPTHSSPAKPGKKTQPADKSLTRAELAKKKDGLGDAQLTKKKGKLHDTEKSARKGVKAQLVGRVKA